MLASLRSATVLGVDAVQVLVEVEIAHGVPGFQVVGLPDASVRESRDRVRAAIRNSGFQFPSHHITISLAPADLRKPGALFDLPIALGILAASGLLTPRQVDDLLVLGELSLDGAVQPARGVLPIAAATRQAGVPGLMLPIANAQEAAVVQGLRLLPVASLTEAHRAFTTRRATMLIEPRRPRRAPGAGCGDFGDVQGQATAKRALEIAAAGGHNALLIGPPGTGKTMLARRLPGILPSPTFDEALEATAIHSVAGLLPPGTPLLTERPFRSPHHTISDVALVGGGTNPRPGEVSLAHRGVLFLDELPEFARRALEAMRQPLEDGLVRIARATRVVSFPARFVFVAAMNPCPCGYLGHASRPCRCTPLQVQRYRARLSGPLLDRMDLSVRVSKVPYPILHQAAAGEPSATVRRRVTRARRRQRRRLARDGAATNAVMRPRDLRRFCALDAPSARLLAQAVERLDLSARGHDRVLRVARTIADLSGAETIEIDHLAEALQFRVVDDR